MAVDLSAVDLETQTVSSSRLLLRPWRTDDVPDIVRACNDPAIARWLPLPAPYTEGDARAYLDAVTADARARAGLTSAIEARDSGQLVGAIGLHDLIASGGPSVGYWVAPWARGRSYAAEATDALSRWAFAHGVHRVWLLAAVGNAASQRTAERAGFQREGVLREGRRTREGEPLDMVLLARLASDPPPEMLPG